VPSSQFRHPSFITRLRNLDRMREITEVAVRHGFGYFFERHRLYSLLRLRRRKHPPPPAQRGRHIREVFDELGPTFVKFGQLLSTRPDIVPPDVLHELVKLQDRVSPFDFSVAKEVIQEDLGLSVERAFADFDPVPLASASIGQVHAALLPGGHRVVVKVQRPDAPRIIRRDIDLLYQFAELLEDRIDVGFSPVGVVHEFASSITRELDYALEARNAMRFAANFSDSREVVVPAVFDRYCSTRVLTMERIEGPTLNSEEVARLPLDERRLLAENIARCWLKQILEDGFVHADPHPANIVYLGDGRFGLLDFGMAGILRTEDLEEGTRLFLHIMRSDIRGIKRSLKRLGMHWSPSADEAVTEAIEENFGRYFGASVREVDPRSLLQQAFDVIYSLRLRLPSRFLLLDKAVLTLEGVVSQLYPDLNLFEIGGEFAGDLKRRLVDPREIATRVKKRAAEYGQILADYPFLLRDLLEEMHAGELEIKYRHTGLENVTHRLDLVTNRLVVALVSIALGVTSTTIAILVEEGPHIGGLSVWGLPGLLASFFFGGWLIYAIIRSGRL
jgi:ubiquinone biosynthesis protein